MKWHKPLHLVGLKDLKARNCFRLIRFGAIIYADVGMISFYQPS
jgi:hypothetical protein